MLQFPVFDLISPFSPLYHSNRSSSCSVLDPVSGQIRGKPRVKILDGYPQINNANAVFRIPAIMFINEHHWTEPTHFILRWPGFQLNSN